MALCYLVIWCEMDRTVHVIKVLAAPTCPPASFGAFSRVLGGNLQVLFVMPGCHQLCEVKAAIRQIFWCSFYQTQISLGSNLWVWT